MEKNSMEDLPVGENPQTEAEIKNNCGENGGAPSDVGTDEDAEKPAAGDEAGQDMESLLAELAVEKARAEEYFNRLARLQADFDNFRKRAAREREDLLRYAGEQLIQALLPVMDNLDRALEARGEDPEKLSAGVEMITRQLYDVLAREGLSPIPAAGEQFNPEVHEAVIKDDSGEHPENTVIQELRKGFTYRGKVIRPAMVRVAG